MKRFFLMILIALSTVSCVAQERPKPVESKTFEAKIYKEADGKTMPYRLFVPAGYDKSKKYPLVLWLHGGWARGDDNEKQIIEGNTLGATIWTKTENQAKNPTFVLVPQCPVGEWWANNDSESKPSKQLETVVELLKDLQKQYNINANRLYVTVQSLGDSATWSLLTHYH